jgi:HPt (histidine-containing phosphotransfer) domain-containing protein
MSFEKAIEASLAAALGDDHHLMDELRSAFLDSARRHVTTMAEAGCDEDWQDAALRLKGLAASFGAAALMQEAGRAAKGKRADAEALLSLEAGLNLLSR